MLQPSPTSFSDVYYLYNHYRRKKNLPKFLPKKSILRMLQPSPTTFSDVYYLYNHYRTKINFAQIFGGCGGCGGWCVRCVTFDFSDFSLSKKKREGSKI